MNHQMDRLREKTICLGGGGGGVCRWRGGDPGGRGRERERGARDRTVREVHSQGSYLL